MAVTAPAPLTGTPGSEAVGAAGAPEAAGAAATCAMGPGVGSGVMQLLRNQRRSIWLRYRVPRT